MAKTVKKIEPQTPPVLPESNEVVKPATLAGRSVTKYVPNAQGKVKLARAGIVIAAAVDIRIAEKMCKENQDLEILNG